MTALMMMMMTVFMMISHQISECVSCDFDSCWDLLNCLQRYRKQTNRKTRTEADNSNGTGHLQ